MIRRARVEDAEGIARVHVRAWQQTYADLVEPGELDDLPTEPRRRWWAQVIREQSSTVHVAMDGDQIVGFSSSAPRESPRPLELETIYVLAEKHGSGAGQELLDASIGDSPAYLLIADRNPRATRFYERNGFAFDGYTEEHRLVRTPVLARRMIR